MVCKHRPSLQRSNSKQSSTFHLGIFPSQACSCGSGGIPTHIINIVWIQPLPPFWGFGIDVMKNLRFKLTSDKMVCKHRPSLQLSSSKQSPTVHLRIFPSQAYSWWQRWDSNSHHQHTCSWIQPLPPLGVFGIYMMKISRCKLTSDKIDKLRPWLQLGNSKQSPSVNPWITPSQAKLGGSSGIHLNSSNSTLATILRVLEEMLFWGLSSHQIE